MLCSFFSPCANFHPRTEREKEIKAGKEKGKGDGPSGKKKGKKRKKEGKHRPRGNNNKKSILDELYVKVFTDYEKSKSSAKPPKAGSYCLPQESSYGIANVWPLPCKVFCTRNRK